MARTDTKKRMVDSAVTLLSEHGAAAVTVDAVLAHSGAPRGSVYHHFPGGRNEIVLTAGRAAADTITRLLDQAAREDDPLSSLDTFVGMWKTVLEASDYKAGCPVVALSVDARDDLPEAASLVTETFATWQGRLAAMLRDAGCPPEQAAVLATVIVSGIEGAIVLCRAQRSAAPLDQVAAALRSLICSSLTAKS